MKTLIIFAPHVDDEVIGCWSFMNDTGAKIFVFYTGETSKKRMQEAKDFSEFMGKNYDSIFISPKEIEGMLSKIESVVSTLVLAPDPHWENHPAHKYLGSLVADMCRRYGMRFGTYSTDMNVPYLRELQKPEEKKQMLDFCFPSQKSLWEYDHKYFLFEGICEWNPHV